MEFEARNLAIAEVKANNRRLTWALLALALLSLALSVKLLTQSEIVVLQTPGMPHNSVVEKSILDKGAQMATLLAVTSAIAQVNPANFEYQLRFLQVYMAPQAYTAISEEIGKKARTLEQQRELGSYYFVARAYDYDLALDRHFVRGDVHTVNAAHDTAAPYVFEYRTHVENYRLLVDEVVTYQGERMHNSEWLRASKS